MSEEPCAYLLDEGEACGAPAKPSSPYCAVHHALCYLAQGTRLEKSRLREIARAGTGRRGKWPLEWGPPPAGRHRSALRGT